MSELPPGVFPQNANESIFNRNVKHGHNVQRWREGLCRRSKKNVKKNVIDNILKRADTQIKRIAKSKNPRVRLARADKAEKAIRKEAKKRIRKLREDMKKEIAEATKMEVDFQVKTINWEIRGTGKKAKSPPLAIAKKFAKRDPFEGLNAAAWMNKLENDIVRQAMRDIREGARSGESETQIKRRLRGRSGLAKRAQRDTCSIVKTFAASAMDIARELVYVENKQFIKGVQYIAILDSRTSIICINLDGKIFPFNSGPRPPQHFNCRSTTAPILKKWQGMGMKSNRLSDKRKKWLDGKPPRKITYKEWIVQQDEETQNDVLGITKASLFRSGELNLDGMVDQSNRPLTLDQIITKEKNIK